MRKCDTKGQHRDSKLIQLRKEEKLDYAKSIKYNTFSKS